MLNAQIAPSTRSGYNSMNIHLICFFQDNCEKFPNIINPDLMGNLVVADDKDRQRRTKAGKPSKQWDYSKQAIIDLFDKINQDDPSTFPIDFEKFTFNAFAAFLKTFAKKYLSAIPAMKMRL